MVLEVVTATAVALLVFAWWVRRAALRPIPARTRPATAPASKPCGPTAMLLAAPTDVAGSGSPTPGARAQASPPRPPKRKPPGPNRRQFLRLGLGLGFLGTLASFGTAVLAFMWPNLRSGFGAQIAMGTEEELLQEIEDNEGRIEFPEGRSLVVRYDPSLDPDGQYAEITNQTQIMALYQKCVHLGCKVPWCASAQWWECPCHGSKYNRWGEWQEGPAPRGLDRFSVQEVEGQIVVDTSTVVTGPSRSAGVLQQPAEGPHCQDAA
jgi:cytochrome b6-f complex iron-sulfur subunit